jgi:hypothetical protein
MGKNITVKTPRYFVYPFDRATFVVVDSAENREICVCANYGNWDDSEQRAEKIASLLNKAREILQN